MSGITFLGVYLSYQQLSLLAGAVTALYLTFWLFIYPAFFNPIRNIPGPKSNDLLIGNLEDVFRSERADKLVSWHEHYGRAISMRGWFGTSFLHISDPQALNHILLTKSYDYPKPIQVRNFLARILGHGILFVEGDVHKRQRRIMNGPFSWANVKTYCPTFQSHANKLAKRIEQLIDNPEKTGTEVRGNYIVIDISAWLGRCTLDLIGLCGFGYDYHQLDEKDEENKLAQAFQTLLKPPEWTKAFIITTILVTQNPWLQKVPTKMGRDFDKAMQMMQVEGRKILEDRKREALSDGIEEKKDLVSKLIKANLTATNPKETMHDNELMDAVTTFTLAGHETSSLTLTWILYHLCLYPAVQTKLRQEIRAARAKALEEGREEWDADELLALPYMDAVIRESARFSPGVQHTERMAEHDDVIPLSKPIVGRDGKMIDAIPVKKGQYLHVAILPFNYSKEIFGEDAHEYRPERWLEEDLTTKVKGFVAFAPILTFLGGPRGCIGWRFALLEVSVILSTLIDKFEFAERDEGGTPITRRMNVVTRPTVIGEEEKNQMPLRVRRAAK